MIEFKTKAEIEKMRKAGKITAQILKEMFERTKPGVTPVELDEYAERRCKELGVIPAFKGYRGFPKSVCISINNQVVHTIPQARTITDTDIVKLDFGVISDNFYGDSAVSVVMPGASLESQNLSRITKESLEAGIKAIKLGGKTGDISSAVQQVVESNGFFIIKNLCGHGIGRHLHEDPAIPNFGKAGTGVEIKPGLVIAIEPIVAAGGDKIKLLDDGWTTETVSGGLAAHFEHTVAITEEGPEVLTLWGV